MEAAIGFISGLIVGVAIIFWIMSAREHRRRFGTIRFYQMEPDEAPIMTAELDRPVEDIRKYHYVFFKVSHN